MQYQLDEIQKLCQDISRKENGLHYASYSYSGHTNEINVHLWVRTDTDYNYFFTRSIYLHDDYADFIGFTHEELLQNLINDLKCYL